MGNIRKVLRSDCLLASGFRGSHAIDFRKGDFIFGSSYLSIPRLSNLAEKIIYLFEKQLFSLLYFIKKRKIRFEAYDMNV